MIKRLQAKLLSWSVHCALVSCSDRDLWPPCEQEQVEPLFKITFSCLLDFHTDKILHQWLFPSHAWMSSGPFQMLKTRSYLNESTPSVREKLSFPKTWRYILYLLPLMTVIFLSGVPVLPLSSDRARKNFIFLYDSHFSSVPMMNPVLTEAVRTDCDRAALE